MTFQENPRPLLSGSDNRHLNYEEDTKKSLKSHQSV